MRRQLPFILVTAVGLFMILQYFVPHETSERLYEYLLDWLPIIGVFTLAVGIWSLIKVSADRIRTKKANWGYNYVTLIGLFTMILFGFTDADWNFHFYTPEGLQNPWFIHFFTYIITPIQATVFALLAFFIASASYRAFRARNTLASLLLVAALILMLRFTPGIGTVFADTANWLINIPNLAAQRAIIIGVGLGIVATALKIILGIERGYLGK
ncbi:MAG: hypothetical protein SGI97_02810 [candidate division Zixibacteria bacterium]|nr:hypothetical protein [candidate division Zixibacteria bacterium]